MMKYGSRVNTKNLRTAVGVIVLSACPSLAAQPAAPTATPKAGPSTAAAAPAAPSSAVNPETAPPPADATAPANTPAASSATAPAEQTPASAQSPSPAPSASPAATNTSNAKGAAPQAPLSTRARQAARQRFDRGLELYDAGDYAGALREFQGALEVTRHPVVLYNVALVYAQLGEPVECVRSVEELQQSGISALDSTSREHLRQVYDEQKARIGRLRIRANVEGALIQLDGVDIGQNAVEDLPIAAGDHIVSTVASGYIPRRMRVVVPPEAAQEVNFNLQPLQTTLAHLVVTTDVPDVEVAVDTEVVGRTPFPASLAFSPGTHQVVLRRDGYREQKANIVLDPGGEGHLEFEMQPDVAALDRTHGVLDLQISEPNSLVSVNGKPLPIGRQHLELPLGRHHLQVHSAGFIDYARDVVVGPGTTTTRVELMPTSEFLNDYQGHALSQRTWGWVGVGAGAAFVAGGVGFLAWNAGKKDTATNNFDDFVKQIQASPNGTCSDSTCVRKLALLKDRKATAEDRDLYGWVGVGVGAALAAVGAGLLIWGDDPDRYAPRPQSDIFGSLRVDLGFSRATLSGSF
jgi:hypothetical protein